MRNVICKVLEIGSAYGILRLVDWNFGNLKPLIIAVVCIMALMLATAFDFGGD